MSAWRNALATSRARGLGQYTRSLDAHPSFVHLTTTIEGIAIAPVKSMGMLSLSSALVTQSGLATPDGLIADRSAMIGRAVRGKYWKFEQFTLREEPTLALAVPAWNGERLTYLAPRMDPLELSELDLKPQHGHTVPVRMSSNDDIQELILDNGVMTSWVRRFLSLNGDASSDVSEIHVLHRPRGFDRPVGDRFRCGTQARTNLTDCGQVLVASAVTLAWMNNAIAAHDPSFEAIRMNAFRPSIVLEGLPPNAEDVLSRTRIGDEYLLFGDPCVRCSATLVDALRGDTRSDKQPLRWLGTNRPSRPPERKGSTFGVYGVLTAVHGPWKLKVGSPARVTEEKQ